MSFKFTRIAVAAALVAVGSAHAAMNTMDSGNSSLALVAYDRLTTGGAATGSFMADLGFNIYSFLPTSQAAIESTIVWNFNNSTVTITGNNSASVVVPTGVDYSPFQQFFASSNLADVRWGVIAGDSVNQRFLTTGAPTPTHLSNTSAQGSNQTSSLTSNMGLQDVLFTDNNVQGTNPTAANGASFSTSSQPGYFPVLGKFGQNGNWNSNTRWNAVTGSGQASRFFLLDNTIQRGVNPSPEIVMYGNPNVFAPDALPAIGAMTSTFVYDHTAGTLTWNGVAPIPEPGTYAMLLAGLAAVGFVARRRRAS